MPSASGLCDNRDERERGREVRVSFGLGLERVGALGAPRGEHGASTHFSNRLRCVRLALAPRLSVCPLVRCDISRTLSKRLPRGSSGRFLPLSLSLSRARAHVRTKKGDDFGPSSGACDPRVPSASPPPSTFPFLASCARCS